MSDLCYLLKLQLFPGVLYLFFEHVCMCCIYFLRSTLAMATMIAQNETFFVRASTNVTAFNSKVQSLEKIKHTLTI